MTQVSETKAEMVSEVWYRQLPISWRIVLGSLFAFLAVPAIGSWLEALWVRDHSYNGLQILVVVLLVISAWKRPALFRGPLTPDCGGLWLLLAMACLHFMAALLSVKSVYWASFLGLVVSIYICLLGRRKALPALSWFLFALFLLPQLPADFQMKLGVQLQLLSTQLTTLLAGLLIPITAGGNIFYINGEAYEVTVACSGLHTWIGFLFAGMLWQVFQPFALRRFIVTLLLAPVIAILFNSLRLWITALVAYYVSPDAGMAIHTNVEYLLFPLGLVVMFSLGRRLYG